jgi:phage/conjugal plasmid C-4 type zinc finger TraR family protein
MERMSEEDEAAALTAELAEREIERIRKINEQKAQRVSREDCLFCGDDIPEARRKAVPGVQYCVEHQDQFDKSYQTPKTVTPISRF